MRAAAKQTLGAATRAVASLAMTERASLLPESRCTAISCLFVRAKLSLYRSSPSVPLPSQSRFARQLRVAAPSVRFAAARILLAAAPTAPPCFRRWRRSSPLPPKGEPLAGRATSYWTPEARCGAKGRALLQRPAASGQRTLSSCRESRQQGTTVYEISSFAHPVQALPTRQWLPLWGSWRAKRD